MPVPVPDPRAARASVGEIEGLRDDLWSRGVAKVLLAGAGGVGVVAEALAGDGARLTVLDGCDPVQLADALAGDLDATVLVVSAPPGADTVAVEIVWDAVCAAFGADDLDPDDHTVLVAPPDHPLVARAGGAPVVPGPADLAYPEVGAWAGLTPYALVPAGLAGVDVRAILASALAVPDTTATPHGESRPSARRVPVSGPSGSPDVDTEGVAAGAGPVAGPERDDPRELVDRLAAADIVLLRGPLAETLAQLLGALGPADGPALLVVDTREAPGRDAPGALTVGPVGADLPTSDDAASELLRWQRAVAELDAATVARRPDRSGGVDGIVVAPPGPSADAPGAAVVAEVGPPDAVVGAVEIRGPGTTPAEALELLVAGAGTLAVHAHLDRHDDASAALLRTELSARTGLVTAFGWGARTAPLAEAVLQVTGAGPDGPAARHQLATAAAEAAELERHGVRVLRLHLTDRLAGLVELVRAIQEGGVHPCATSPDARA